jgi:hypothetical protein
VPRIVIVPAVTVDTWLPWSAGSPAAWHPDVAHTSVGVWPVAWQIPHPWSLRPETAAWIAATLVPPLWQAEPVVQPAAALAAWDVSIEPCIGMAAAGAWHPV